MNEQTKTDESKRVEDNPCSFCKGTGRLPGGSFGTIMCGHCRGSGLKSYWR